MRVRIYPYHILRENKQAQGAHADRIQTGMSHAFGKSIGRSARVRPNQKIISVLVDEQDVKTAKIALERAMPKITCNCHIEIGTDVKSIGTRPKKMKMREVKKKDEEESEEKKEEGTEEKSGEKKSEKKDTKGKGKEEKKPDKKEVKGKKK